ncbi:tyrosine-type recombinase/integrase [Nocardia sp. NPDC050408]|uniref:tyrosine-type recombinase/integrase n=1 Tax=Nocardia sp. NPDC050408 TaxID=3364319 RepID=UPI0037A596EE
MLVSPELASVLASIISRLRRGNAGIVALTARYDPHERTTGPDLPHLFQRRHAHRWKVLSYTVVRRLLNDAVARTGLRDAAGDALAYTAHDFRRMFATEAVTGGLPVHIAARLLGHRTIVTTQTYLAVFQDDLIRAYRTYVDGRRAVRPDTEYREPTTTEWQEFQQHFHTRKLELGTCARPYGTGCQHEHACLRCPMLRVAPTQRNRLIEIIRNLDDRITEATMNGWLGEVQGLKYSLAKGKDKLAALDRTLTNPATATLTDLGVPMLRSPG